MLVSQSPFCMFVVLNLKENIMKRIINLILSFLVSVVLYGQGLLTGLDSVSLDKPIVLTSKEKKVFEKYAKKVGILKYSELKDKSPSEFWHHISDNNLRYGVYKEAFKKRTKMAENTAKEVNNIIQSTWDDRRALEIKDFGELGEFVETVEVALKSYLESEKVNVKLINNNDVNAFAVADGYIGINIGCFYEDWISLNEIFYLVGHEYSHIMLAHQFVHKYFQKKQNFKMNMIAGISSAVIAAATVYEASLGVTDTTSVKYIDEIVTSANQLKKDFYFKFSREEEFEADTYSMYYMMNKKVSPYNAINLLDKFAEKYGDKETEKDDTHPSNSERKKFLYYILTEYNNII